MRLVGVNIIYPSGKVQFLKTTDKDYNLILQKLTKQAHFKVEPVFEK